ncbi:MAG: hypothetical protein JW889_13700 [Verrucomicrobia bacterium]|nr:hypothetical protein [Verrucomicrobiota bacterium]
MGLHVRFGLVGVLLAGAAIVVLLLRAEPASIHESTAHWDRLLIVLGVVLLAAAAGYVLALRRRRIVAARTAGDAEETAVSSFDLKEGIERLIGKRAGRIVNVILLVLVGLVVLALVGFLGYILYVVLSEGV